MSHEPVILLPCIDGRGRITGVYKCDGAGDDRLQPCVFGSCCDDSTGECDDNVAIVDCPPVPPRGFTPHIKCADLIPPCGTPPVGSCCDDSTGECLDNIAEGDCDPSWRWTENVMCADLDPPCGAVVGACCADEIGVCEDGYREQECYDHFGPTARWAENVLCENLDPSCGYGACCDTKIWECEDNVHRADCQDWFDQYRAGEKCDELEPPCVEPSACEHCEPQVTPRAWLLTTTGIGVCEGCYDSGGEWSYEYFELSGAVNGSLVLNQEEGRPCHWRGEIGHFTQVYWDRGGCTGNASVYRWSVWADVNVEATHAISVFLQAYRDGSPGVGAAIFGGSLQDIPDDICIKSHGPIPNDGIVLSCLGAYPLGRVFGAGGSAVLVPIP